MKRLSFGARGLKNREETAKENENGNIARGGGAGRASSPLSSSPTMDVCSAGSGKSFSDPTGCPLLK